MIWQTVACELALCGWIVVVLGADLLWPQSRKGSLWKLTFGGLVLLGLVLWWQRRWIGKAGDPMFVLDQFAWSFKWLFVFTVGVVVLMTRLFAKQLSENLGEFYLLLLTALLGTLVLASTNDLLLLFIGLELLTFSLYVMAAYVKTDARSVEAGLKYLILGSISSGFLIYGVGLLYGASGGTGFGVLRDLFASGQQTPLANAGLLFVLAGLGFKIAAVPFHLWVPDVYEGAPVPVVALLSVGSKMAGVVALLRVLYSVCLPAQWLWADLLAVLAAATMLYGNLGAIPQTNIKRLLGYSSIGHAGYLLMGLSTASPGGAQAVGVYLLAYLFSNLAAFLVVAVVSGSVQSDSLEDYDGLSQRSPFLAAAMFLGLLSLAGVPPLAGFVGKLVVLLATAEANRVWLVALGAVNVAISLYYYLMVVRRMYIRPPKTRWLIPVDRVTIAILLVLVGGILIIGIFQEPFLRLMTSAIMF